MTAFLLYIHGEFAADLCHGSFDFFLCAFEIFGSQGDTMSDLLHFFCAQTTGGDCGSADTHATGYRGLLRIAGDGVFVQGNVVGVAALLQLYLLACQT